MALSVLADTLKQVYNSDVDVKIIIKRHGEKLYETLVAEEEMVRAVDLGDNYCIPCDARDMNYDKFEIDGDIVILEVTYCMPTRRRMGNKIIT